MFGNGLVYAGFDDGMVVAIKAGKYVQPTLETFTADAANAYWDAEPGIGVVLVDDKQTPVRR